MVSQVHGNYTGCGKDSGGSMNRKETTLEQELAELLNSHSVENDSNTPDFILAQYLSACLDAFNDAVRTRTKWFAPPFLKDPLAEPATTSTLDSPQDNG